MKNNITNLEINNFKSIKRIEMACKRINVLIGKPNVGKSNILEALSLYITPYCDVHRKVLEDYIRYEKLSNLMYDQNRKNQVSVISNIGFASMYFELNSINQYVFMLGSDPGILYEMSKYEATLGDMRDYFYQISGVNNNLPISEPPSITRPFFTHLSDHHQNLLNGNQDFRSNSYLTPIKKYHFKSLKQHTSPLTAFLRPPYGDNLYSILESNTSLFDECTHFFNEYGLELLVDTEYEKIDVQKKVGNRVYKIPYSLAADTLQRIIFHLAAIETNYDSILLLEEPENHSFPPYISLLANKIIENKKNQFFIATHSPYMLTEFIEQCPPEEVAIFVAGYKNYETTIKRLNDEEIKNIMETDIDLFFNISAFQ